MSPERELTPGLAALINKALSDEVERIGQRLVITVRLPDASTEARP